ncbi:MAG: DUF5666 domain-containing protein [Rubrivivax sp.]
MTRRPIPEPGAAPLRRREWLLAALAALAVLGGCGGGVDSGGTGTGNRSTLAVGTISGFGSIVVNGVHYDESAATIDDDDGRMRSRADLQLGMRTAVLAGTPTAGAAVASSVTIRSELGGAIDAIDLGTGRLVVLGQRVDLGASTVVDGGLQALAQGDEVTVYATLDLANGRYAATRVERRSGAGFDKIRGVVGTLDLGARTLAIGTLLVDWSGVAPADAATVLAPGRRVLLQLAQTPATGVRRATRLVLEDTVPADRERAEIEGRITAFSSATAFELDGVPVDASAARFPDGQAGLALGVRAEATGRISGGVLIATEVSVENEDESEEPFEISGRVDAVDAAAQTFVVRGVTVHWSEATRFEGGSGASLAVGDQVELVGELDASGERLEATQVQVED